MPNITLSEDCVYAVKRCQDAIESLSAIAWYLLTSRNEDVMEHAAKEMKTTMRKIEEIKSYFEYNGFNFDKGENNDQKNDIV